LTASRFRSYAGCLMKPLKSAWYTVKHLTRLLAVCIVSFAGLGLTARADTNIFFRKTILVLNSYSYGFSATDAINRELYRSLGEDYDLLVEQMDSKRFYGENYEALLGEYLYAKYKKLAIDLIIVSDDDALNFMLRWRPGLFPEVPVVFCGVNDYSPHRLSGYRNVTGVAENIIINHTIDIAIKQNPAANAIYIVVDDTTAGRQFRQSLQQIIPSLPSRLTVHYLTFLSIDQLFEFVSSRQNGIVVAFPLAEDGLNFPLHIDRTMSRLIRESRMPVYTFWTTFLDYGAVGGYVVDPGYQGQQVADMARRILGGALADDMPVLLDSSNYYAFNQLAMQRYKLSPAALPAESIIINRPLTLRESQPALFWALVAVGLLLAVIVFLLTLITLRFRNENVRLERAIRERTEFIQQQQKQLFEAEKLASLGSLVSGVAHEINTPLGVSVTAASHIVSASNAFQKEFLDNRATRSQFSEFLHMVQETAGVLSGNLTRADKLVKSFKQIAVDQIADDVKDFSVASCIEDVLLSLRYEYKNRPVEIAVSCSDNIYLHSYPGAVLQILTNLIMNSLLHAYEPDEAAHIRIEVAEQAGRVSLVYTDDGRGMSQDVRTHAFEPFFTTARSRGGTGLGMSIMYNLVTQRLGGSLELHSEPGQGLRVEIELPVAAPALALIK